MANYDGHQDQHSAENRPRAYISQDMLHKVPTKGGPGTNTRHYRRSQSESIHSWPEQELIGVQRPDQNETSLAIVPRQHPLLPLPQLEAEGAGLLDRILSVFQDPKMFVRVFSSV